MPNSCMVSVPRDGTAILYSMTFLVPRRRRLAEEAGVPTTQDAMSQQKALVRQAGGSRFQ